MEKKFYKITLSGDSMNTCVRELTDEQYELINSILDECSSEYVAGYIKESPIKYIVEVNLEINEKYCKHPNSVIYKGAAYVSEDDRKYVYSTYEISKHYHYFFDSEAEALQFATEKSTELKCNLVKCVSILV